MVLKTYAPQQIKSYISKADLHSGEKIVKLVRCEALPRLRGADQMPQEVKINWEQEYKYIEKEN